MAFRFCPRLVDQGAKARPNRYAPARSADLLSHTMQDHACTGVRIRGEADIRYQSIESGRYTRTILPGLTAEVTAASTTAADPGSFILHAAVRRKVKRCAAHSDDIDIGRFVFDLGWAVGIVPTDAGVRPGITARNKDIDSGSGEPEEILRLGPYSSLAMKVSPSPRLMDSCRIPGWLGKSEMMRSSARSRSVKARVPLA